MAGAKSFGIPRIAYPYGNATIPVSALEIENAPSLVGGNVNGPAEEIPATVDLTIASRVGGVLDFHTLTELEIAGVNLANSFSQTPVFNGTTSNAAVIFRRTDDANLGPGLRSEHESTSPALNDFVSFWNILGRDSANTLRIAGFFQALLQDPAAATYSCIMQMGGIYAATNEATTFRVMNGGLLIDGGATVLGGFKGGATFNCRALYTNGRLVSDSNTILYRRAFTFATLPAAAGVQDGQAVITDGAAAPVWLAAAAGGGAVRTPVISNGAAWNNG